MLIEIKNRFTGSIIFTHEAASWKLAVEFAIESNADLGGADLRGANLYGADLRGADLGGADLRGADLGDGLMLIGKRPFFQLGPIGSRQDYQLRSATERIAAW